INVLLNLLFVVAFDRGVDGVAWATTISQAVACVLVLRKLSKREDGCRLELKKMKIYGHVLGRIVRIGLPAGVQSMLFSISNVLIQSSVNSFGEIVLSGNSAAANIEGFVYMGMNAFQQTAMTFSGQNVGAGLYDRVTKGAKQGTLMAVGTSTAITLVILIFGKFLMGLFTDTAELIDLSYNLMKILAVGYIAVAVTQSLSGIMRGAGDTMTPMWISLITTVAIRVPIAYGISWLTRTPELPHGQSVCIQISLLLSWLIGALLTVIFYRLGKWKTKALK
ncbi:MAG: MATE family efflux transporter, partial [Clostridia bacterium]|nr:MATE family efflux transporter [Clostridia bacterium]